MRGGAKKWSQEDEEFFLQNENELTDADMAELLGRTEKAIWMHRNKLRKEGKYDGYKTKIREDKKMNVAFDQISCADAAKMIKVDYTTVVGWCRNGIVNCTNVCDGTSRGRYLLEEDEVAYLQDLVKKFGVRKAMLWYRKDKDTRYPKPKQEKKPIDVSIVNTDDRLQQVMPKVEAPNTSEPCKTEEQIIAEKATKAILYIQDIKARLADLEEEKKGLLAELEECKQEIMELL